MMVEQRDEDAIAELRQDLDLLRSQMPQTAESDVIEGHVHRVIPTRVAATSDLPATRLKPTLYYVTGPPVQLFLVDKDGQRELGYTARAAATSDLTLTTSNQDVVGASLTLPHIGTYVIRAVFDFEFTTVVTTIIDIAAIGVLTDSGGAEEAEQAGFTVPSVTDLDAFRATVAQQWIITTTSKDEVFKLRARKSATVGTETIKVKQTHTTILASSFLGGGQTALSHQHSHDTGLTGVSADDHHDKAHTLDASAHSDVAAITETRGQILRRTATEWDALAIGASRGYLRSDGTDPLWTLTMPFNIGDSSTLTIASGLVTVTRTQHDLSTEGGDPTDTLGGALGGVVGDLLVLQLTATDIVTIEHFDLGSPAGSRFLLWADQDVTLVEGTDSIWFVKIAIGWKEITRTLKAWPKIEVPWGPLRIALSKPLPAATNNATLDDDWAYKSPWTNEAVRISRWYVRFVSNLAANATFQLFKNGSQISGAEITVTSGNRDAAIDAFTEQTLADGDSLEVHQTAGDAEDIGGSAFVHGDQDVVVAVTY